MKNLLNIFTLLLLIFIAALILWMVKNQTQKKDIPENPVAICDQYKDESTRDDCIKAVAERDAKKETCIYIKDHVKRTICERTVYDRVRKFEEAKSEFGATHQLGTVTQD